MPSDPAETNFKLSMCFPRDNCSRDGTKNYTDLGYIIIMYRLAVYNSGENLNTILAGCIYTEIINIKRLGRRALDSKVFFK